MFGAESFRTYHVSQEDTPEIVMDLYDEILVDRDLLHQFVKTTFRGYCTRYQSQTSELKGKMECANGKEGRHRARKLEVCDILLVIKKRTH